MSFSALNLVDGRFSSSHVNIELWSEVIIDFLGRVLPLLLRFFGSHDQVVADHFLSKIKIFKVSLDISVLAKVWNWIIDVISSILFLVLILVASGGGADRIRAHFTTELDCSIAVTVVVSSTWDSPISVIILSWLPFVA